MIIKSIEAKNHLLGWELEKITFDTNPTLLVGLSGVGKTQILQTIYNLHLIVTGFSINGFEWKVIFVIDENEYVWEGRFSVVRENETVNSADELDGVIIYENLKLLDSENHIIQRDKNETKYIDSKMPQLLNHLSGLYLFKKEGILSKIITSFENLKLYDYTQRQITEKTVLKSVNDLKRDYFSLKSIKNSNENILTKLLLVSILNFKEYEFIKGRVIEIFPQIEDLIINYTHNPTLYYTNISISIKEKGVPREIEAKYISSGMLRTIIHIAQIYLANDGSVILIDEFENSLGTNCMDILTEDLIHENKNIQFIATSHHPYIINALPYQYWKIVTRKAGVISAKNASEYKLGKSKQKAFIQLTELLENQY